METDKFAVEIISAGEFLDTVSEKTYRVQTYTIRLNWVALAAWRAATATDDREDDETFAAWHPGEDRQAYRAAVEKRKAEFDAQIAAALQITEATDSSFSIACVVSEIFAVAYIHKQEEATDKVADDEEIYSEIKYLEPERISNHD